MRYIAFNEGEETSAGRRVRKVVGNVARERESGRRRKEGFLEEDDIGLFPSNACLKKRDFGSETLGVPVEDA